MFPLCDDLRVFLSMALLIASSPNHRSVGTPTEEYTLQPIYVTDIKSTLQSIDIQETKILEHPRGPTADSTPDPLLPDQPRGKYLLQAWHVSNHALIQYSLSTPSPSFRAMAILQSREGPFKNIVHDTLHLMGEYSYVYKLVSCKLGTSAS